MSEQNTFKDMILTYPNLALITPTELFDFKSPPGDPKDLAALMMQVMNEVNAVGLAANQLGIPYSVLVIRGDPYNFVCFNPRIIHASEEQEEAEEGCLSFPGVNVKVKRPKDIRARFQMPSGETTTRPFEGLSARAFQHEMDHLAGKLFINRANRYHRDKAMKRYYNERKCR